ncbi:POA1 [Candida pseudojiufengensis]|uniref:POA1 n=1 Tax=Candida pseudojiufengensis TaxID=497109 RepID=UPI002225065D|nr:POA1 [Candida pseudojiufengensis]KAI5964151.1 POA1 [Candida pseudojiufengensis]
MTIKYITGDLFSCKAIDNAIVLAHACNTKGSWGGGIAAVFRRKFPIANKQYSEYCHNNSNILGKCLLLKADDFEKSKIYIACLFTSDYNQSPEQIASNTTDALRDLSKELQTLKNIESNSVGEKVVNMPKINAGIFGVPWELTEKSLNEVNSLDYNVYVL